MAEGIKISEAVPTTSSATPILIEDQQKNVNRVIEIKNPLQIPLVLVEIFKNLCHTDLIDLKTCRLVNKLWESEATPILKRKTRVYFDDGYDEAGQIEFIPEKIERYLVEMKDFGNDDFDIVLDNETNTIGNHLGACMKLLDDFFPYFGAQINSLCLAFSFKEVFDFEIFQQIVKLVPNLKELTLNLDVYNSRQILVGISDLTANVKQLEKVRKLDFTWCDEDAPGTATNQNDIFDLLVEKHDIGKALGKFVVKLVPKLESIILRYMMFSSIFLEYAGIATSEECKISEVEIHTWFAELKDDEVADDDVEVADEDVEGDDEDEVMLYDNKKIIAILCRWPTPLRKLHYYSSASCVEELDPKGLETLLKKHAHSLEDIKISISARKEFKQVQKIIMPTFPKLTNLNIQNPYTGNSCKLHFKFHSTFDQHFPLLNAEKDRLLEMFDKPI